ncbi:MULTISPECIES: TetR/AcrR family transcriptional regulator [Bacillus]|uniref:TetR/AcrR family transcriptional regulator n=1 Tax=Bacillus TaxID=1386 RepID=UPI0002DD63A3|nr:MULTISPECIES: TetR/AcrR family transcriptional regulator [Bacillus]
MAPQAGLNQEIITNKALEIADKEGMDAVTMATLARELHVKTPSLYNHVKGLTEVKEVMAIKGFNLLFQHLKEATLDVSKGFDAIQAMGKAYIRFANQYPGMYEASLCTPDLSSKKVQVSGDAIISLMREALSIYSLTEFEMIHTIRGIRSLLYGLVDLKRKGGFNYQVDLEDSLESIIGTFMKGLDEKMKDN